MRACARSRGNVSGILLRRDYLLGVAAWLEPYLRAGQEFRGTPRVVSWLPGSPRLEPGPCRPPSQSGAASRRSDFDARRHGPQSGGGPTSRGAFSGPLRIDRAGRSLLPQSSAPARSPGHARQLRGSGGYWPGRHGHRLKGVRAGLASPGRHQGDGCRRGGKRHRATAFHARSAGGGFHLPRPCHYRARRFRSW